jgi:hypothetical protein
MDDHSFVYKVSSESFEGHLMRKVLNGGHLSMYSKLFIYLFILKIGLSNPHRSIDTIG